MYFCKWFQRINFMLNIVTPLFLYFYLHLSWIEMAIAFIAFDITLNIFEQITFITLPWAVSKIPLIPIAQWQYNGISKKVRKLNDKMDFRRKKYCKECDEYTFETKHCYNCSRIRALAEKHSCLVNSQRAAKENLDKLLGKRRNKPTQQDTAIAIVENTKQDTSLITYFKNISTECNQLINTHRFDFLISVRKSADSIASILKSKPEGEAEIPGTLCYRMDNLIKLLKNLSTETDEVRNVYMEDAKTASNAINEEMQQIISSINKLVPGIDMNTPEMLLAKTKLAKETIHV